MNTTNTYRPNPHPKDSYNPASRDYKFINKQKRHRDEENTFKHSNSNENHYGYKNQNNYPYKNFGKNNHQNEKYTTFSNNKYYNKNRPDNRSHSRERKDYYYDKTKKGRNYQDDYYERRNNQSNSKDPTEKHHSNHSNYSREKSRSQSSSSSSSKNIEKHQNNNFQENNDYHKNKGNFREHISKDQGREDYHGIKSYQHHTMSSASRNYSNGSNNPNSADTANGNRSQNEVGNSINCEVTTRNGNGYYEENSKDYIQTSLLQPRQNRSPRTESPEDIEHDKINKKNNYNFDFTNNNSNNLNNNFNNSNNVYDYTAKSMPNSKYPNTQSLQSYPNPIQSGFSNSNIDNKDQSSNSKQYQNSNYNPNNKPFYQSRKQSNLSNDNQSPEYDDYKGSYSAQALVPGISSSSFQGKESKEINSASNKTYDDYIQNNGNKFDKLDLFNEQSSKYDEETSKKYYNQINPTPSPTPHSNSNGQYYSQNSYNSKPYYNNPASKYNNYNNMTKNYSNNSSSNSNNQSYYYNQVASNTNNSSSLSSIGTVQTNTSLSSQNNYKGTQYNKYVPYQANQTILPNQANQSSQISLPNQAGQLGQGNLPSNVSNANLTSLSGYPYQTTSNNLLNPSSKNIQINISLNNQYNKEITREVQKTINNNMPNIINQPQYDNSGFTSNGFSKEISCELPGYEDIRVDTNILTTLVTTKSNDNRKNFGKLLKETLNDYVINRENSKFTDFFKNLSIEGSPQDPTGGKPDCGVESVPIYFFDDSKLWSQEKLNVEKDIKTIKTDLGYYKKKKDAENVEIKNKKETILKIDLSRNAIKAKQNEIRKTLDEILSEII